MKPDGSVLYLMTGGQAVVSATDRTLSYDVLRDFDFIAIVTRFPFVFTVSRPNSRFKTIEAYLDEGKREPGELTYGTSGVGSTLHMAMELLLSQLGVRMTHVPYKGGMGRALQRPGRRPARHAGHHLLQRPAAAEDRQAARARRHLQGAPSGLPRRAGGRRERWCPTTTSCRGSASPRRPACRRRCATACTRRFARRWRGRRSRTSSRSWATTRGSATGSIPRPRRADMSALAAARPCRQPVVKCAQYGERHEQVRYRSASPAFRGSAPAARAGSLHNDVNLPGRPMRCSCARRTRMRGSARSTSRRRKAAPGVLAVYTGDDYAADGLGMPKANMPRKKPDGSPMFAPQRPALVIDRVRYVGDPVAMVIAETLAQAKDAAELVDGRLRAAAVGDRRPRNGEARRAGGVGRIPRQHLATMSSAATRPATDAAFAKAAPCRQAALRDHPRPCPVHGAARRDRRLRSRARIATRSMPT